jgi:hypothetical protein
MSTRSDREPKGKKSVCKRTASQTKQRSVVSNPAKNTFFPELPSVTDDKGASLKKQTTSKDSSEFEVLVEFKFLT